MGKERQGKENCVQPHIRNKQTNKSPYTGCNNTLVPPLQPKPEVAQYNQTYCLKVKPISAMDF